MYLTVSADQLTAEAMDRMYAANAPAGKPWHYADLPAAVPVPPAPPRPSAKSKQSHAAKSLELRIMQALCSDSNLARSWRRISVGEIDAQTNGGACISGDPIPADDGSGPWRVTTPQIRYTPEKPEVVAAKAAELFKEHGIDGLRIYQRVSTRGNPLAFLLPDSVFIGEGKDKLQAMYRM